MKQVGRRFRVNATTGHATTDEIKTTDFTLPVKTLPSIMRALGHTKRRITVLKLDVEGSEWAFLEDALDRMGCDFPVDQLTVEWHHFAHEARYGVPPHVLTLTNILHECGFKTFSPFVEWGGVDPKGSGLMLTYALASYCRRCEGGRFD